MSGLTVQRWYPAGGLYLNGQRVATQDAPRPDTILTPPEQSAQDVRTEFSSLLRENAELRRQLAPTQQSGEGKA